MSAKPRLAWKLVRQMADGSFASLFINRRARLPVGQWLPSACYPTPGFAVRPGWHCTAKPEAPHLSPKGRIWVQVEMQGVQTEQRPASQGGKWYLADMIRLTGRTKPAYDT